MNEGSRFGSGLGVEDLEARIHAPGGWPQWAGNARYDGHAHPGGPNLPSIEDGANCQRYAYAVLSLFGRTAPSHRSSELWSDPGLTHPASSEIAALDMVLFSAGGEPWGAHVAVYLDEDELLHLCREVGAPAIWHWRDFAARPRYAEVVGAVRVPSRAEVVEDRRTDRGSSSI